MHGNCRHGHSASTKDKPPGSEYTSWKNLRARCNNPRSVDYKRYGGRGIKVCKRWDNYMNFYSDMGPKPSKQHSLDRINVDGDYEPNNCRWALPVQQANNRRSNRIISYNGRTKTLSEWASFAGISLTLMHYRLKKGWSFERALQPKQELA